MVWARPTVVALAAALLAGGCSLEDTSAPPLTAPSEFGLSVTLAASPDQLPRDGSSQSVVTVTVRDDAGRPVAGQRLSVATNVGRVSESEVVTDSNGRATFAFVAPDSNSGANLSTIQVTPIGSNAQNAVGRTITITLTGRPGITNTTLPTPSFTVSPAAPTLKESVTLNASATTDEGAVCGDVCTYSWDFGGEATASGRIVSYQFQNIRTYPVTLTVTDAAGSRATLTQNVIVSQGAAPTATFTFSPTAPAQFQTVFFTAEGSRPGVPGRTISYSWKFGDGATDTGVSTSHSYSVLGTYPVTLTVTDNAGVQTTTTQSITVINGVTAAFNFSPTTNNDVGDPIVFNAEESRGSSRVLKK